jgi:hypothetical protein
MPIRKEISYPIFLECCQYTDDVFWENIFEDLAYGKPPMGTYIAKGFLCCSYKKREFSYKIEKKDPKTVHDEVYDLLTRKLELLSQREKIRKKKAFTDMETTLKESRKCWSDIRKKNMKELLIELYVVRMKNQHSLSIQQARFLINVIMLALVFKVITVDDIEYTDGYIQHIEGIDFIKKQVVLRRDLYDINVSFAPHIVLDQKLMSDTWDKYLKDLRKTAEIV